MREFIYLGNLIIKVLYICVLSILLKYRIL